MSKFCVFCGQKPQNKNKEHIIPQWLSKHTGRFDKICEMGDITNGRQISFASFTFPACTACNEKFGKLEAAAKTILLDVLAGKSINAQQTNTLLDWFDKIRVGLWLADLTLSKDIEEIAPKFHIADRVGRKDRMLIVEHLKGIGNGIYFSGTFSPVFKQMPSAFMLVVNDVAFINASEHGLVSNKLGFPQISKMQCLSGTNMHTMNVTKGRNKTTHPVVSNIQASPTRTIIYQPIFRDFHQNGLSTEYNVPYVLNHSMDYNNGVGGIFAQRTDNRIIHMSDKDKVKLLPQKPVAGVRMASLVKETLELQNYILNTRTDIYSGSPDYIKIWESNLRQNNRMIDLIEKRIQNSR